jgi:polysaccharide biosynthesis protein PslE
MDSLYAPDAAPLGVGQFVWRNKVKLVVTFAVGMGLTLLYLSLAPRKYQSEAKLLVRIGRESITLDPTATTGQYVAVPESRESDMHAVEELLGSRATAETIVNQFGPGVILEKKSNGRSISDRLSFLNEYNLNPLRVYSLTDKAVKAVQKNLGMTAAKNSSVLSVSYQAEDPELARDVLTSLLSLARDQYLRVNRTTGSQEFFERQLDSLRLELVRQEEGLRQFKDEHGLAALEAQRSSEVELIGSLKGELLRARAEQNAVQAEVALRRKQLGAQPSLIVTEQTTGQPQTVQQTLREKIYELEVREQELAARLKDESPQLAQIRKQIAEARRIMGEEQLGTETKRGISQTHQAAELALQEREAQRVALEARTSSLAEKIATGTEELKALNAAETQLSKLERELDLARTNYRKYSENFEQARIDQELETAKISSLNMMQAPTLTATPVSPQPIPTLALGFVGSLLAGLGLALFTDRRPSRAVVSVPANVLRETTPVVPSRPRRSEVVPANPR